jgi:hypothetical protein
MKSFLKSNGAAILRDLIGLAGVGLTSYGAWQLMEAAGFIVAGVLLMAGALLSGRNTE